MEWKSDEIGSVKLYCGDCREVLPTITAEVLITDPPYGVNLGNHAGANEKRKGLLAKKGYTDYDDSVESLRTNIIPIIEEALKVTKRAAVFCADKNIQLFPPCVQVGGVYVPGAIARNSWGYTSLNPVLFYGAAPELHKGAKPTVLRSSATADKTGHPTTKPRTWMDWLVCLASLPGETILDPFMGSGTTGVSAIHYGRKFIGIEINQTYFDIARKRIELELRKPSLLVPKPKMLKPGLFNDKNRETRRISSSVSERLSRSPPDAY